nr:MAG TPA: restriction alleviation protein [Caudoviricetes sp.]
MSKTELELKPCPFCGGKVIMMRLESLETGFVSYYVSHNDPFNCAYEIRQQSASETMQEAANKWNRRADTNDP